MFASHDGAFSAVYGVDSLNVTSENCFSRGKYLVLSSFVCGVLVNWLLQSVVYILIHPAAYRMLKIRYNKRNYTFRLFHKGNLKIRHFRIANMLAHSLCGYIPLIAGFVVGDVSICYFAFCLFCFSPMKSVFCGDCVIIAGRVYADTFLYDDRSFSFSEK